MADACTLQAEKLAYRAGGRDLITAIDARFPPGSITAILGPSGSGKSTLIKCLTTVYRPTRGRVLLNHEDVASDFTVLRQRLGYVPQDDVIHKELMVRDAFYYAARLRLDSGLQDDLIDEKIDRIAGKLGLGDRKYVRISRLSGGQRKRVNIGVELLADPSLLVLDEPASGLDPGTEEDLLSHLRELAEDGRTVILTSHSMEYLDRVDRILVLVGGHLAFAGGMERLLSYFRIPHVAEMFKTLREKEPSDWGHAWQAAG